MGTNIPGYIQLDYTTLKKSFYINLPLAEFFKLKPVGLHKKAWHLLQQHKDVTIMTDGISVSVAISLDHATPYADNNQDLQRKNKGMWGKSDRLVNVNIKSVGFTHLEDMDPLALRNRLHALKQQFAVNAHVAVDPGKVEHLIIGSFYSQIECL